MTSTKNKEQEKYVSLALQLNDFESNSAMSAPSAMVPHWQWFGDYTIILYFPFGGKWCTRAIHSNQSDRTKRRWTDQHEKPEGFRARARVCRSTPEAAIQYEVIETFRCLTNGED